MAKKCDNCGYEGNPESWMRCEKCLIAADAYFGGGVIPTRLENQLFDEDKPNKKEDQRSTRDESQPGLAWRPMRRTPMLVVKVLDDDGRSGETFRFREKDRAFVIGRSNEVDVPLPNDAGVSEQHMEVKATPSDGAYRWIATDINSSNGSFMQIKEAPLRDGHELIIGSRRYKFQQAGGGGPQQILPGAGTTSKSDTALWTELQPPSEEDLEPCLVLQGTPEGEDTVFKFNKSELHLGKSDGDFVVSDDAYLDSKHCTLWKADDGKWKIRDDNSLNGIWLRFEKREVVGSLIVLIGEQKLIFRVP